MKRLLIAAMFLGAFSIANAQTSESQKLIQLLAQHPQQDTLRVNHLNRLMADQSIPVTQRDSISTEALAISKKINYPHGIIVASYNLSTVKLSIGKAEEALDLLQQAYTLAEKEGEKELQVECLYRMGNIKILTADSKEAINYYLKAEAIAQDLLNKSLLAEIQFQISYYYLQNVNNYPLAMEWILKSIRTGEEANCLECLQDSWMGLGTIYSSIGDQKKSLLYYQKATKASETLGNGPDATLLSGIGERYRLMGKYPEAIKAYKEAITLTTSLSSIAIAQSNLADVYVRMDSLPTAFQYAFTALQESEKLRDVIGISWIDGILARAYLKKNMPDSALYYATKGLSAAKQTGTIEYMRDNTEALANAYVQKNDFKNAYKYRELFVSYRDSMQGAEVTNKANILQFESNKQKTEAQITLLHQQKESQRYFLIGALILVFLIMIAAIILFKNNRHKQKANILLTKQKHQIEDQRDQTNKAMTELQDTQKQLIQSEKMASLGELTAGIAHEIQNPLNFVNNFSDVNSELIDELNAERLKPQAERDVQLETEILNDIKENEQKINHHGKRADAIVKGMLQHSRKSTGEKEPTDLNALADEYLRLSYHGLRAKDKSFNATMETDFDPTIGKINVIPQEMGRVLLNLFNNAFYATNERQKTEGELYKPTISVSTQKCDGQIQIKVSDNGNGIPQKVLDKIYQPFFTTKPTGQGTGLGLSLSYDIIKVHHGQIKVETMEGDGTEFIIVLPATIPVNQLTV